MWIEVVFAALFILFYAYLIRKWRNPKCSGVLPPGSMGLPLIGETLELLIPSTSMDVHPFIKKRIQKYGPIFRTSMAGQNCVVSADPELNTLIFHKEGILAEMYYMDAFSKIFNMEGENRMTLTGVVQKYVRSLPAIQFGIPKLREGFLAEIESTIVETFRSWSEKEFVEVNHAASSMLCELTAKKVFSYDPKAHAVSKIIDKFCGMTDSFASFPVNIPGTTYHRVMKDKEFVMKFLKEIVDERLRQPENCKGDFLDKMISEMKTEKFLTKEFLHQYLFSLLFGASESNGITFTTALNNLFENPKVLEELEAEHDAIMKRRENPNSPLSWEEYKSMTFTHHVVSETLRLMNVSQGVLRKAIKDIHHKGYTIPAGWIILLSTSATDHLNPEIFKDPLVFNPWRWKEIDPTVHSKILKPFGEGSRQCAGAEFSKAFQATLLHVLVTKYKATKVKEVKFVRKPLLVCDGFYVKFAEKNSDVITTSN